MNLIIMLGGRHFRQEGDVSVLTLPLKSVLFVNKSDLLNV